LKDGLKKKKQNQNELDNNDVNKAWKIRAIESVAVTYHHGKYLGFGQHLVHQEVQLAKRFHTAYNTQ
jgi:hypothetical protein